MKGGSKTTTQTNTADPWVQGRGQRLYDETTDFANSYRPYTGERVADPNADQMAGGQMTRDAAGNFTRAVGDASGAVRGVMNAGPVSFLSGDIAKYMNPFTEQVVNTSLGDLDRARRIQGQSDSAEAAAAGAFGGSRQGVQEAETNRGYADAAARTSAGLRESGYNTAAGLLSSDLDRTLAQRGQTLDAAGRLVDTAGAGFESGAQLRGLGAEEQANAQAKLDAKYDDYRTNFTDRAGLLNQRAGILGTVPQNTTSKNVEKTQSSLGSSLLGLGMTAGSLFLPGGALAKGAMSKLGSVGGMGGDLLAGAPALQPDYDFGTGFFGSGGARGALGGAGIGGITSRFGRR